MISIAYFFILFRESIEHSHHSPSHFFSFPSFHQVLLLITLLTFERVKCQNNDDIDEFLDEEDNDDEPEPIKKRQMNVVRDTIKSVVGAPIKFFTNGRLIKGVQMAIQSQRHPKPPTGSTIAAANGAGNIIGTIYRTMRSQLIKNSAGASSALRKQLQTITKRLSNSKVIIGNLVGSHKMSNREESATKEATADLSVPPTAETKTAVKSEKKLDEEVSNIQGNNQQPMQPYPYQMMVQQPFYQSAVNQQQLMYPMPVYPELML